MEERPAKGKKHTENLRNSASTTKRTGTKRGLRRRSGADSESLKAKFMAMKKQWRADRARLEEQLARAQKMESLGLIAGGLAHDFNNYLEVILGFASLTRLRLPTSEEDQEPVRMIEEAARRAADLATQLLDLTREETAPQPFSNPSQALQRVLKIIRRTFDRKIQITSRIEPELPFVGCEVQRLEQAILNLAINARDAMAEGGILTLSASRCTIASGDSRLPSECAAGNYVLITVRDTGTGMGPPILRRIFQPLFTTKPESEGSGLGLAMVQKTVKAAGGFIEVESKPGQGSRFMLGFPAVAARRQVAGPKKPVLRRGQGKVLIVDDEPLVRAFVRKGLEHLGYSVLAAESGAKACEIYQAHAGEIGCVLLDMVMPEMSGLETYERLRAINAEVKVILSSGYNRSTLGEGASSADFLCKPYTLESLSEAVKRVRQD